jgi:hypothetical protein
MMPFCKVTHQKTKDFMMIIQAGEFWVADIPLDLVYLKGHGIQNLFF